MASAADVMRVSIDLNVNQATQNAKKFERTVTQVNQRVGASNKKAASTFEGIRSSVARARSSVLLWAFAVTGAVAAVNRLVAQAQKVSQLSNAFDTLGKRVDLSGKALASFRVATKGLVSDMELMKQANNAIILGVATSEKQFAELAEGAVRLGRAVGLDATPAIESLVTGIGRASRQMLDNLGIIVKVDEATQAYADAIGVAVGELTTEQQKTAFQIEATRQLRAALVGLTDQTMTMGDAWQTAGVSISNTFDTILKSVNQLPNIVLKMRENKIEMLDIAKLSSTTGAQNLFSGEVGGVSVTGPKMLSFDPGRFIVAAAAMATAADKTDVAARKLASASAIFERAVIGGGKVDAAFERATGSLKTPSGLTDFAEESTPGLRALEAEFKEFEFLLGEVTPLVMNALNGWVDTTSEVVKANIAYAASLERLGFMLDEVALLANAPGLRLVGGTTQNLDPLSAVGQAQIEAAGGPSQFGTANAVGLEGRTGPAPDFEPQVAEAEKAAEKVGVTFEEVVAVQMAQNVAQLGANLVGAFLDGESSLNEMFAAFMKQIAAAIIQALILRAITKSFKSGGTAGGGGAQGGIVGEAAFGGIAEPFHAAGGTMVRGGVPGVDSVPIIAQRREMVLPRHISEFIMEAAGSFRRESQATPQAGPGGNALPAASTSNFNVSINAVDGQSIRRMLEDNPDAFASAFRMAQRRGAM